MKKILLIFLAFALISVSLPMQGCTGGDEETLQESTEEETEPAAILDIFASGDDAYTIVRPEKVSDEFLSSFVNIKKAINEKYGLSLDVKDDWLKTGDEAAAREILVGHTNRPESDEALGMIGNTEYIICAIGEKIVINANTDELIIAGIERFISDIVNDESNTLYENFRITGKGAYAIDSIKVNGVDIAEYRIVIPSAAKYKSAANVLVAYLEKYCAISPEIVTAKEEKTKYEIVFGITDRDSSVTEYGSDSAAIYMRDGKIFLGCGSDDSSLMAVNVFISEYLTGTGNISVTLPDDGTPVYKTETYDREVYIADPSLMPVHWDGLWKPDSHMLDYQEKIDCLYCVNKDHIFTVSHRGDFIYYPENSIESYISVWKMGGDCIETDLHYTLDGVCVIMHDATLTRMTDVDKYKGKNGYPDSVNISDWTYEQLQVLHLKSGQGGTSASVTIYKIPTLEEVLQVAKGRFFLILDKQDQWRYCDIDGIQTASKNNFIYPLMEKTGNFESVLISYGHITDTPFTADMALKVQEYVYERTGQKMLFYLRGWTSSGTASSYAKVLATKSLSNSAILVNGAFDPTNKSTLAAIKALKKTYPDTMIGGWTIDTNGYDCETYWEVMYSAGMRSIMSNNMFALVRYAATK